ncbi:MAG TPA: zinc ribbon domain-containing protein [Blastocatellia bacterium]|nr:zinc ribbon domain-containing protein [Blastocatellia bacterium]
MKSPTGELLSLRAEANTERQPSGFTGGLDLYDELVSFLGSSPEPQQAVGHVEIPGVITLPPTTASVVPEPTVSVTNSGALPQTGDVIKITGPLVGFEPAKNPTSAIIVCGDCGQLSDSDELFCIHCGGLLEPAAASAETAFALAGLCDDCGAVVESDEIFCPACGAVMTNA